MPDASAPQNKGFAEPSPRCPDQPGYTRTRPHLGIAVFLVVLMGLASRAFPFLSPGALSKYPGDALWALMVSLGIAFLRPKIRPPRLALLALTFCWLVEFSQLYQAPWINSLRATRLGHLVLGSTFHWPDLFAYAVGILAGWLLDISLFYRQRPRT